ncbi:carcinoembryonic antigen-related cell adhesion molecule 21-like [Pteronotus mesoamericanus]|uniref:carcinoembryonic antigen-related cell adhesion molecule 21-like n=1 Tax=Pteronotus mesoamericanus TaxID=1884717 RepID=UPI0023EC7613|nr:carcinoembryonic antigen-related cell adhesion molecule 21-like [Pteronotus parnellii mesoamericanus]
MKAMSGRVLCTDLPPAHMTRIVILPQHKAERTVLTFWSMPTTAQLAIVSANVAEGKDVRLEMRNVPPGALDFVWYRGDIADKYRAIVFFSRSRGIYVNGPEYTGRERILSDGSLLIKKVTANYAGKYTVVVFLRDLKREIGFGQLHVYPPVILARVEASNTTVTENDDSVVLHCYTNGASIRWLFNGMKLELTERMTLSKDHLYLTINPVKKEDSGTYQCEASNPFIATESWPLALDVKSE